MQKNQIAGTLVMGCFALFWSVITLACDGVVLYGIAKQFLAYRYAQTAGIVTKSVVKVTSQSKSKSYGADLSYNYSVNDTPLTGTRYRFGAVGSDYKAATNVVNRYPAGKSVTVYYDPSNPAEAVLLQGIEGVDLVIPLFLLPFNAVMVLLWWAGLQARRGRRGGNTFSGVRIFEEGTRVRARIIDLPAFAMAGVVLAASAFLSIFVIAFLLGGADQSLSRAAQIWAVLLAIAGYVYLRRRARETSGVYDLTIDRLRPEITLPKTFGRLEHVTLPLAAITGVTVKKVTVRMKKGRNDRYLAVVNSEKDSDTRADDVAGWSDENQAHAFAEWLRKELKVR